MNPLLTTDLHGKAEQARAQQKMHELQRRLGNNPKDSAKLKKACEDFESLFMAKIWQQMRATVPREGYLHSKQEEQYMGMFEQELASKMASSGGIGLGKMLFNNLQQALKSASRETAAVQDMAPVFPAPKPIPLHNEKKMNPLPELKEKQVAGRTPKEELVVQIALQEAAAQVKAHQNQSAAQVAGKKENNTWQHNMQATELASLVIQEKYVNQGGLEPDAASRIQEKNIKQGAQNAVLPELNWPLAEGRKSSGFGWRDDPFTGKRAWHAGVDLAAPIGSPITSCWPGTVSFSGRRGGYGNLVIVDHPGGWQSFYGHNSENLVRVGDKIAAGKEIAKVGSTGRSTGPHLHFELRQGNQAWNPEMILNRMQAGLDIGKKA